MRRIGHVKRLRSELQREPLRDREVAKQAQIQIDGARSAEDIATRSTKPGLSDPAECGAIVKLIQTAYLLNICLHLVRRLCVAGSIQPPAICSNCERSSRESRKCAIGLPPA